MAGCCGLTGGGRSPYRWNAVPYRNRRRRTQKVKKSQKRTKRRRGGKQGSTVKGFTGKWKKLARLSK